MCECGHSSGSVLLFLTSPRCGAKFWWVAWIKGPSPVMALSVSLGLSWEKELLPRQLPPTVVSEAHCLPLWFVFQSDPIFLNNIVLWKVLCTYTSGENSVIDSFPWRPPTPPARPAPLQHLLIQSLNLISSIPPISYPPHPKLFLYESIKEDSLNEKGFNAIITTKTIIIKFP